MKRLATESWGLELWFKFRFNFWGKKNKKCIKHLLQFLHLAPVLAVTKF